VLRDRDGAYWLKRPRCTYSCNATVTFSPVYPPAVNDPTVRNLCQGRGWVSVKRRRGERDRANHGCRDFSFCETIPSAFSLGQGSGENPPAIATHHPHFALDEEFMPPGIGTACEPSSSGAAQIYNKENQWQLYLATSKR
jgi:metal-dependent amidase/aminoacylase/carboxypeptidase family protein